ncbi:MAG: 2Fe-2S iron-sulfur cluster-binding protein [Anaerolineae bacterium]
MPDVTLTIDGQAVTVPEGTTILQAAQSIGHAIPTICYHEACTPNAVCRMCVVEVEGARLLSPACVALVREGMAVRTRSERVERSRRTILELLASAVDLTETPDIQAYSCDYDADSARFDGERRTSPVLDDNPMFIRDYAKCVLCWRCVQVCADDAQYAFAINFGGRGFETTIATFFDRPMPETTCVFCGQCVGVCPTGALKPRREWLLQQGHTADEIIGMSRAERRRAKRRGD